MDTTNPTVTVSTDGKVATFEMKDKNGVIAYGINQSTTTEPNYTTIAATTNATSSYTVSAAGTYVIWVKDVAGRIATTSFTISQNLFETVWDFAYTGGVQSFTVPCSGTYKLEVWGAQGGTLVDNYIAGVTVYRNGTGGKGGYSSGNINLNTNQTIYIVVGGEGASTGTSEGGYNGGGFGGVFGGSGGGATHISKSNTILLNTDVSNLFIVAGGGGGGGALFGELTTGTMYGGSGGGTTGGDAYRGYANSGGGGGTQTSGGTIPSFQPHWDGNDWSSYHAGEYGIGGDGWRESTVNGFYGAGGGDGYYGGSSGQSPNGGSGGGGGSGYIGGVTNGSMQNGVREGNGYAKITLVSIN